MSFPIATASDMLGNVLVLDKHRHTIISFSAEGQVNGEIGGMGTGPGWFYHPTSLLVDEQNRIWVAQGFNNLVQALQLPQGLEPEPVPEENVIVVDE